MHTVCFQDYNNASQIYHTVALRPLVGAIYANIASNEHVCMSVRFPFVDKTSLVKQAALLYTHSPTYMVVRMCFQPIRF